jgi:hypothetical protein
MYGNTTDDEPKVDDACSYFYVDARLRASSSATTLRGTQQLHGTRRGPVPHTASGRLPKGMSQPDRRRSVHNLQEHSTFDGTRGRVDFVNMTVLGSRLSTIHGGVDGEAALAASRAPDPVAPQPLREQGMDEGINRLHIAERRGPGG